MSSILIFMICRDQKTFFFAKLLKKESSKNRHHTPVLKKLLPNFFISVSNFFSNLLTIQFPKSRRNTNKKKLCTKFPNWFLSSPNSFWFQQTNKELKQLVNLESNFSVSEDSQVSHTKQEDITKNLKKYSIKKKFKKQLLFIVF